MLRYAVFYATLSLYCAMFVSKPMLSLCCAMFVSCAKPMLRLCCAKPMLSICCAMPMLRYAFAALCLFPALRFMLHCAVLVLCCCVAQRGAVEPYWRHAGRHRYITLSRLQATHSAMARKSLFRNKSQKNPPRARSRFATGSGDPEVVSVTVTSRPTRGRDDRSLYRAAITVMFTISFSSTEQLSLHVFQYLHS